MRTRRDSRLVPSQFAGLQQGRSPGRSNTHLPTQLQRVDSGRRRHKSRQSHPSSGDEEDAGEATDRTPLMAGAAMHKSPTDRGYGLHRPTSKPASIKSANSRLQNRRRGHTTGTSFPKYDDYDVNNPPSVPNSPGLEAHDDVMVANGDYLPRSPTSRRDGHFGNRDMLIDIDGDDAEPNSAPPSPRGRPEGLQRARTIQFGPEGDVCFPAEDDISEIAEDELGRVKSSISRRSGHRRRNDWPQLWHLDDWSRQEKEIRDGERRAKKVSEPVLVGGRLRPSKHDWHHVEEDAPYRYTYFCDEFESTIHSQTISELLPPGGTFRDLFIPEPPELSDSSDSEEEHEDQPKVKINQDDGPMSPKSQHGDGVPASRISSVLGEATKPGSASVSGKNSGGNSGRATPQPQQTPTYVGKRQKPKKYGPRPTFWLDVLSPSEEEMRVLARTFGIHALTTEDILMQEAREKVELFRNYYFINYRTFEQDPNSEDYLEPVDVYACVFRFGIITFHFSQIPHPANVRRRIRQLTDYLMISSDWISYAIIDDITDVYQPLINNIEHEVDDIDDMILNALQSTNELGGEKSINMTGPAKSDAGVDEPGMSGMDMLRRIGECRKKVMSLYRLLGQKADVIKGFAKRCNEHWDVAPKSEIGLYLGDIQDHIITMSSNLGHYETLLSRAHSNYLAQVNIRMGERQESTADILGKLTVIGTIVLPMNIICGMWGVSTNLPQSPGSC